MTPDWTPLDTELARWRDGGLSLPLWWRDDDAVDETADLHRLARLADELSMPVHLAIIPAHAQPALARYVDTAPNLIPVTHGWTHHNHAPMGEKKAEFGAHRPRLALRDDLKRARNQMATLFGPAAADMFVPPWNRIAPPVVAELPGLGVSMLSTFTPRAQKHPAPGLGQINTHLDPINWRAGKALIAPDILIDQIARQLSDRRHGRADASEPYGILTHHLVHDPEIWTFTEQLLTRLLAGPVHRWSVTHQTPEDSNHEPT